MSEALAHHPRAVLLATLACVAPAFCWGLNAIVAAGAFERGISPERLAQTRVVVALVPLAAWLLVARRDLIRPPRGTLPALVAFGACIVVVNFAYYLAISRVPVGVAISLQYTAPVLVLVGAAIVGRRLPSRLAWSAAALTLASAVLVSSALGGLGEADPVGIAAGIGSALSFAGYLVMAEIALFLYQFVVGVDGPLPDERGPASVIVASVTWGIDQDPATYELNRAVLDRIMASLDLDE